MQSTTVSRRSARATVAVVLAIVGMLALGGAWTSVSAEPGSGNGNATGRPEDGSVGNGNPHANKPDPSQNDGKGNGNKGHECDDNKGVGQGNPAHPNDCAGDTSNPPAGCTNCGTGTSTPEEEDVPEGEVLGVTEEAPSGEVLGITEEMPAAPAVAAAPAELPRTGSTSQALGFLGIALLAFGASAILFTRREDAILA